MVKLAFATSGQTQNKPILQSRQPVLPSPPPITALETQKAHLTWLRPLESRGEHCPFLRGSPDFTVPRALHR